MPVIILFSLFFSNFIMARSVRLKDLAVTNKNLPLANIPGARPSLVEKLMNNEQTNGVSVSPHDDFYEKLSKKEFDMEQTFKDLDLTRPPVQGKFDYHF
jgi:hypothetical protein